MKEGKSIDSKCHALTLGWIREKAKTDSCVETCGFYEVKLCCEKSCSADRLSSEIMAVGSTHEF